MQLLTGEMDKTSRGVSAIVEYNYDAAEADELTLIKGAIIQNIKVQSGGWWEGALANTSKRGMFPDSYVRVLEPDDKNPVVLRDKTATINRRCKAIYSYTQNNNDELSLAVGDIIEVIGEVEEGWWRGKLAGKIGVFPSNFVTPIQSSPILPSRPPVSSIGTNRIKSHHNSREDLLLDQTDKDAPSLPPKPVREMCIVTYPYTPQNEDELELKENDIITIITKELPDNGWWKGELRGKVGVFPDNFVKLLSPESVTKIESTSRLKGPINKSPSNASDKIGVRDKSSSRDSLNDLGISPGNVAAYRKSLENKSNEINRKSLDGPRNSDIRKSLENLDERKVTPPPVLTKKPTVPLKKSPTVGSVGLYPSLKSKTKSMDGKPMSQDNLDGVGGSKQKVEIAGMMDKEITGDRITRRDDSDFDRVERQAMLPDMRASRARAPGRRPPTSAINTNTENNNNDSLYVNGSSSTTVENISETSEPPVSNRSHSEDEPVKQKPWEKNKAPWMAELKASQAKKSGVSTSFESTKNSGHETNHTHENGTTKYDMSKSFSSSYVSSAKSVNEHKNFEIRTSSVDIKGSSITSTAGDDVILRKDKDLDNIMTKSITSHGTKISITDRQSNNVNDQNETTKVRPTSVNLRNRSMSPVGRLSKTTSITVGPTVASVSISGSSSMEPVINLPPPSPGIIHPAGPVTKDNVCARVQEMEQRMLKLEATVQEQSAIIDALRRSLKDETDRVSSLRGELEKYAQCVTQV